MIRRNILTISMVLLGLMAVAFSILNIRARKKTYAHDLQVFIDEGRLKGNKPGRFKYFRESVLSPDILKSNSFMNRELIKRTRNLIRFAKSEILAVNYLKNLNLKLW